MVSFPVLTWKRGVKPLVLVLIIIVVVLLALVVAVGALSAYRTSTARKGWDGVLGSWEEVMQRYPATEVNASALELERLAGDLGVVTATRNTERWRDFPKEKSAAFDKVKPGFSLYRMRQMERYERGKIDPPPVELSTYMSEYDDELIALRRHLNRGVVPIWESDLSLAENAPSPNHLGHIDLQKLLSATALARLHAGDVAGAEADIKAAWHLSRSLRDRPHIVSQLTLVAGTRMQLGVLRHIRDLDPIWLDRLAEHDFRASFIESMKVEGWIWLYDDDAFFVDVELPTWHRVALPLPKAYARLCMADVSDSLREHLVNLEQVDAICDRDLSQYDAEMEIPVSRWNLLGEQVTSNLGDAIHRLARLELDLELTRLLVEADAERRANGGAWPESLNASRESVVCPDDRWSYRVTDAGLEIALSRDVQWLNPEWAARRHLPTQILAQ